MNLKSRIIKLEQQVLELQTQKLQHQFIPALFYCGWLENQTEEQTILKNQVQSCYPYCCFNHMIGLPTIKYEDESGNVFGSSDGVPLWPYEKEIIDRYENTHYYALNKCRGAGATELLSVRYIAFKCITTRIKDRKCLLIAGTNQDAAKVIMRRIKEICDKVHFVYRISPKSETPGEIYFHFGMIMSIPANPDDIRSYENVGDVILEESAFWKLIDDSPVLLAAEPHVAKSSAHIGVISTPNGRSGFFWNKIFNPEFQTKYDIQVLNWREVVDVPVPVISKEEILLTKQGDPSTYDQEFDNQFIISENRAFGEFDKADFMPIDLDNEFEPTEFE